MSTVRARNRRGEGARLRDEILDAAISLLDQNDGAVLSLRGVARGAGISAPPIYAHFESLQSLVDAVLVRSFDDLYRIVSAAAAALPADDPVRALDAAGLGYVRFGWEHRARYQMMFSADGYATNAINTFELVRSLITSCADAGLGHSTDPRIDTWILWAGLHGVATLDKPARAEQRRLGTLDRPAMLQSMIHRLARIHAPA